MLIGGFKNLNDTVGFKDIAMEKVSGCILGILRHNILGLRY